MAPRQFIVLRRAIGKCYAVCNLGHNCICKSQKQKIVSIFLEEQHCWQFCSEPRYLVALSQNIQIWSKHTKPTPTRTPHPPPQKKTNNHKKKRASLPESVPVYAEPEQSHLLRFASDLGA